MVGLALALAYVAPSRASARAQTEVVVTLDAPPLAEAVRSSRVFSYAVRNAHVDLHAASSLSYLRSLSTLQTSVAARVRRTVPGADIRWRYGVVLDGFAAVVPAGSLGKLRGLPGVAHVWPSVTYHSLAERGPSVIGAPTLWGPDLATAGNGMKIGIIDDGVDQDHPYFSAAGYTMPPGFPKGQTAYTTRKVIVARAFAPKSPAYGNATKPFDPTYSDHATHVAGIAAGVQIATAGSARNISGVAPHAYIGNYKVYTIPTDSNVGLDGNSPEVVAGIEAAVRDGMDVINLSIGEPEITPSRDIVVKAINAAADAGVVPAIAAGNDFDEFGHGSVGSPGTAAKAITVAAATTTRRIADFSSAGPTPLSLLLKPDVTAPGVDILSSVPPPDLWESLSGTSMASPHVAGAAALLRERHPSWTVAQIKSALTLTGDPIYSDTANTVELSPTREGGGMIDLPAADNPLVFTAPTNLAFGFVKPGASATRSLSLTDAGGGAGAWAVAVKRTSGDSSGTVTAPATVTVPGALTLRVAATAGAPDGEVSGFVVLTRSGETRRIPFWAQIASARLGSEPRRTLTKTGTYRGDTRGKRSLVNTYRYPDNASPLGVHRVLAGPEQVFRFRLTRPVANFGVALRTVGAGVSLEPRIVFAGDENRLTGYAALPLNINPYLPSFYQRTLTAATLVPVAGVYDIVFDTPAAGDAGAYTFRFWVNDRTPPTVRLLSKTVRNGVIRLRVTDAGSGVDPELLRARLDGKAGAVTYRSGVATVKPFASLTPGRHTLVFRASDYQETKNNENVGPILPNSRTLRATVTAR